jgi:hypothetical protein
MSLSQSKIGVTFQSTFGSGATTGTINHTVTSIPPIGSAAGSQDLEHSKTYLVTSGTPLVLDVTALADPQGATQNFAHVTGILVSNDSTTAGQDATVGGGSNPLHRHAGRARTSQWRLVWAGRAEPRHHGKRHE